MKMKCVEVYEGLYHQEPFDVAFCPYRISPLGAHIDHQYGKINGLAIDKGIHMAYHPKQNGIIELQSLNFPKRAQFFVNAVPEEKQGDWADHLRGAAKMLGEKYRLKIGLSGVIEGSLPIGGLSSSASVIICFLSALCKVNDIHLEPMELILTAKAAENQYVGVSCGKLDQSCEVLSKKNHLLYLDLIDSHHIIYTLAKQIQLQLSLNYKDRFESASSLAPAQLLWYTYTDCRIDYIMTNKRNPVAKKLFKIPDFVSGLTRES